MRRHGFILLVAAFVVAGFWTLERGVRRWSEWREAREIAAQAGRLDDVVRPLAYRITLTVDPTSDRFFGQASIRVRLARPRRAIWLHGRGLKIRSATARDAHGRHVRARWKTLDERGLARLLLAETLPAGEALLKFRYEGRVSRDGEGLFRVRRDGRSHVFSQMQPIAARNVFPSFDQPGFKTPFEISVRTLPGYRVIGNAPLARVERGRDGWRTWHLRPTRPLPTYLVALAIGRFVEVAPDARTRRSSGGRDADDADRTPGPPMHAVGVTGADIGPALVRMLGQARFLLGGLERFFARAYPFAKLDLVAVPDFAPVAMENAGAVMLRESLVAVFADAPDARAHPPGSPEWRRWIAGDPRRYQAVHWLIHQLAHQWIGNLVTPAWWSDLWFNESFGRWIADHELRRLTGDDRRVDLRATLRALRALDHDGGERARPLHRRIATTDDIVTVFDPLLYDKGAAVIEMIERHSGRDVWRDVLRRLMASRAYGTIDTAELIRALAAVAKDPGTAAAFADFVYRTGVPLIGIAGRCERDADGARTRLEVVQSRFRPLVGARDEDAGGEAAWRIPLCLTWRSGDGTDARICRLLPARVRAEIALDAQEAWCPPPGLRAAAVGDGYYRYLPDRAMRDALWRDLDGLEADEAVSLVDHMVAAVLDRRMPAEELLERLEALAVSRHWPALVPQIDRLHRWRMLLSSAPAVQGAFTRFLRRLYAAALSRARRPAGGEVYPASYRREARHRLAAAWIVDGAAEAPDAAVTALLVPADEKSAGDDWSTEGAESFAWTLDLAVLRRDPARMLPLIAERLRRDAPADRRHGALMALGHSGLEAAFEALKSFALSPEADGRDVVTILDLLARDPVRARAHWQWVAEWHERLAERLNLFTRPALIRVAAGLCEPAAAQRLARTVARWREPLAGRTVALRQTVERIRACAVERRILLAALSRALGTRATDARRTDRQERTADPAADPSGP